MMIYNKEAKSNLWLFATLLVILSLSFVFAEYIVNRAGSATDAKVEDVSFIFNVTVNNSWITGATDVANVSQINFTFPASFTINSDTDGSTGASNSSFGLTGQTVYWLNNTHMILNVSAEIAGGHGHFWVNVTPATPGQYNVSVQILNATGITQRNISIIVNDTPPPQTAFISHSAGQNISGASVFLNTTVTDNFGTFNGTVYFNITNGSAVLSLTRLASQMGTSYNATLDTTTLNDGIWNVTIYANDSAYPQAVGNINVTTVLRLTIDNTNPQVALSSPVSVIQNVSGNLLLNASVTDGTVASAVYFNITNGSGVVAITRSATLLPGGLSWNMTLDTTVLNDGFWNITVIANDSVNNMNITTIRQIRVDNTAPTAISFNSLEVLGNFSNLLSNFTMNITVTDSGSGIHSVYFNLSNGTSTVSLTRIAVREAGNITTGTWANYSFSGAGLNLSDGEWNITAVVNDSANSMNITAFRAIRIDSTSPTLISFQFNTTQETATYQNGTNVSGPIYVKINVTELNIKNVTFMVFNATAGVVNLTSLGSTVVQNLTVATDGVYSVNISVYDYSGHSNFTSSIGNFIVDRAAPILTLTKETSSSTTISYATAASDGGGSSVLSCAVASPTGTVDQTNKLITGLACGAAYSIVYNCTDYAGNVGTDTESFATDACTSNGGSGGGSSSSSSSSTSAATVWTSTIAEDEVEL